MATDNGFIVFSTGKRLDPNRGIVGIDHEGSTHEGYDGGIPIPEDAVWSDSALTPAECVELADVMLARWAAFRAKYAKT